MSDALRAQARCSMLLSLALVRAASAHVIGGSCRAQRAAVRMTAAVDGAPSRRWDLEVEVEGAVGATACHAVFAELAASEEFARETWARRPLLLASPPADFAYAFTMDDVETCVESDFLDAGRGVSGGDASGWKMAQVSTPRGPSFAEAKMRYCDVQEALKSGTVVFNSAGFNMPKLASVSLAALDAFGLPNCLNLYLTAAGMRTSAPPHTDKQDVFVLQTAGSKHWRVFEPPPPAQKPAADPLARGKANDALPLSELGPPLIDAVLRPGTALYIPAGWPHTTDTVHDDDAGIGSEDSSFSSEDSVHLTVGLDTHIWGLDYAAARKGALARAMEVDELKVTELAPEAHWRLMGVPQHLGFLRHHGGSHTSAAVAAESELVACARAAEAARWEGSTDAELSARLGAPEVVERLEEHARRIVEIQRALYLETARDNIAPSAAAPPMPGMPPGAKVSLFRVKPHLERLELAMEGLLGWFGLPSLLLVDPPPVPTVAAGGRGGGGGGGGGAARPKPAAAAADKGGFGGGGGGAKAKKKPAKKKKR